LSELFWDLSMAVTSNDLNVIRIKGAIVNRIVRITGVGACFLALIIMNQGHWLALQSFAWVRMTIQFSQDGDVRTALQKTFSGQHPCSLCHKIRQGRAQEDRQKKQTSWIQTEKLPEALWEWSLWTVPPAPLASMNRLPFPPEFHFDFIESPPTPPPRA
jgi:hypothetical protein